MTRSIQILTGVASGDSFTNTFTVQVLHGDEKEARVRLHQKLMTSFLVDHWADMRSKASTTAAYFGESQPEIPELPDLSKPEEMCDLYYSVMGERGEKFDIESGATILKVEDDLAVRIPEPLKVEAILSLQVEIDPEVGLRFNEFQIREVVRRNAERVMEEASANGVITGNSLPAVSLQSMRLTWLPVSA